jgi:CubicO group peptidase (beta-lactamase class C family)
MSGALPERFGIVLLLALAAPVLVLSGRGWAQSQSQSQAQPREIGSRVDEYMAARVARDRFSGSILVARDGAVLVRKGYGLADRELDVACTPRSKFRIGSLTKQFTAMAVLVLQEQGKIDVHEKIKTYLPDCPKAWEAITVEHLLTHSSGIPSYTGFPDYGRTQTLPTSVEKLVGRFKDRPLEFAPGEKFEYSNSGYALLGYLIDRLSGRTYASFLAENIFEPLGMKDTGYDSAARIIKDRASGYAPGVAGVVNASYLDMSIPYAAGALYSTVDDLERWDRALRDGKLVPAEAHKAMVTPHKQGYGYGCSMHEAFGRKTVEHGGGINGFGSYLLRFPAERTCVVVLCNLEGVPVSAIAHDLAAIAFGETYTIPHDRKAITLDPKVLDAYVGRYVSDRPELVFTITRQGDGLHAQLPRQSRLPIFPESETAFFYKAVDAQIDFVKDAEGNVTHLVLHQNGRDIRARRTAPETEAKTRP